MIPEVFTQTGDGGYFRIFTSAPGMPRREITFVRGAPTGIGSMSSTDPFGDASASLSFPAITGLDRPGQGDLSWLIPYANIDICWYDSDGIYSGWAWEGFIISENVVETGYNVSCKGALYQVDNFLAEPWFPQYPVPYELLIRDAFDPKTHMTLRSAPLMITWPADWNTVVPAQNQPDYLWFLRPWGVQVGQKWTGLTTRNTGGWEPTLTGFVQSLLSVMYTEEGGQWTIKKNTGRVPELFVRPAPKFPMESTLEVVYGAPGVAVSISRDFSQSTNIIYGQGTDLNGSSFTGAQVSRDGQTTYYEPFAALPYSWPQVGNPRLNQNIPVRESRLQFPQGMDLIAARNTANAHLMKFADPGYTGSIELESDPTRGGLVINRQLIKAGETILVKGIRGTDILFHITEATCSPAEGRVSLTVDTKFRDALTVAEVRARTRDALDPVRLLRVGQFSTTVQDSILPWSYTHGSGVIPSGGAVDATKLFNELMGPTEPFPWTTTTRKYPPKKYPSYYIKVDPKSAIADKNWSGLTRAGITKAAIPVKLSQSGQIRLIQLAAYDEDGNVMKVRFHVSFFGNTGISVRDMPKIPAGGIGTGGYPVGQFYPFFRGAFEKIKDDGTEVGVDGSAQIVAPGADLVVGWGNYFEGAGYFPGSSSHGSPKTGLLVDESVWSYDTTNQSGFDKYSVENSRKNPNAGMLFVMIYCDDQPVNKPVYFLGRMFRNEGGQA